MRNKLINTVIGAFAFLMLAGVDTCTPCNPANGNKDCKSTERCQPATNDKYYCFDTRTTSPFEKLQDRPNGYDEEGNKIKRGREVILTITPQGPQLSVPITIP